MFDLALDLGRPAAIRYPRTFAPHPARELPVRAELALGRSETLRAGTDVALLALGHLVYPALEAAELLAAEGISAHVVNARFVRPLDLGMVRDVTERFSHVFTLEEHSIRGGFAAHVLEELAQIGGRAERVRPIALPDAFTPHGTRPELLRELRLDPAGIASQVRDALAGRPLAVTRPVV
jgi:1-deoxy-D-xylulose-5-phosphate synthase